MHPRVRAALAAQYDAFRRPAPRLVSGCPCCCDPAELATLVATPREALTAPQLESYASSALLTVGDVSDLRHYWPRLAELSITGALLTDAEVVFSKPRHGDWRSWPDDEQRALVDLATAQVEALTADDAASDEYAVDTWVCAFAQFLDDVTVLLPPLLRPTPGAEAALRQWYGLNERRLKRGKLWNAFWDSAPFENAARVRAWFQSPTVRVAIDRAFTAP